MAHTPHPHPQLPSDEDLPDVLKHMEQKSPKEVPSLPGTTGKRFVLSTQTENYHGALAATTSMSQQQERDKVMLLMTKFKYDKIKIKKLV